MRKWCGWLVISKVGYKVSITLMYWLIVGGESQIGQALSKAWSSDGHRFHNSTRRWGRVSESRPYICLGEQISLAEFPLYEAAVICVGESNVTYCERHPLETWRLNVDQVCDLARILSHQGCYVLLLSSARVFDGRSPKKQAEDKPGPRTEYGRQKTDAESGILNLGNSGILRLSKVIHNDTRLIRSWRAALELGQEIHPFDNVFVSLISLDRVVDEITVRLKERASGIFHVQSEEDISYADLARKYCLEWGLNSSLIAPTSATDHILYPRYSSLI